MDVHADSTSTSELLFASFSEQVLVQNVSHENDLIFIPIVSHKDSFCHRGKSKHGIWLFSHELAAQGAFDFFLVQSQMPSGLWSACVICTCIWHTEFTEVAVVKS